MLSIRLKKICITPNIKHLLYDIDIVLCNCSVTVTSTLTEGKTSMPFTAILYHGDDTEHTFVETGMFYGCNFFDFHTEFNETKLPKPT